MTGVGTSRGCVLTANGPRSYEVEAAGAVIVFFYAFVYLNGRKKNEAIANAWYGFLWQFAFRSLGGPPLCVRVGCARP